MLNFKDLVYDESVPSCLRTEDDIMIGYKKKAGTSSHLFYWYTGKGGRNRSVHRIIWKMLNGDIPEGMVINHKDTNGLNNKISNLELCTVAENNRRQRQHVNGVSRPDNDLGITGVKILKVGKYSYSVARIRVDGKLVEKLFSHLRYGEDVATDLAKQERAKMLDQAIEQGFRVSSE
jgi:hypothetical protein